MLSLLATLPGYAGETSAEADAEVGARRARRVVETPAGSPLSEEDTARDKLRLPPLPAGVTELRFQEIFERPVGPRGLTYSAKTKSLEGRQVRILGFMVKQGIKMPGRLLFTPYPMATHESEYGLAEDLPPSTVVVEVPTHPDLAVPFTPGPLLLTGTLALGPREEPDGRVSHVRLLLNPPAAGEDQDLLPELLTVEPVPES